MKTRLSKIDDFLSTLESSPLSEGQESVLLSCGVMNIGGADNVSECKNSGAGCVGENNKCVNKGVACSDSKNSGCENVDSGDNGDGKENP